MQFETGTLTLLISFLTDNPTCALGKIANTCNIACVTTCSGQVCPTECVPGCFCPQGTVELEDICLAEEQCPAEPSMLSTPLLSSHPHFSPVSVHPLFSLSSLPPPRFCILSLSPLLPLFLLYGSTDHLLYLLNSSWRRTRRQMQWTWKLWQVYFSRSRLLLVPLSTSMCVHVHIVCIYIYLEPLEFYMKPYSHWKNFLYWGNVQVYVRNCRGK